MLSSTRRGEAERQVGWQSVRAAAGYAFSFTALA